MTSLSILSQQFKKNALCELVFLFDIKDGSCVFFFFMDVTYIMWRNQAAPMGGPGLVKSLGSFSVLLNMDKLNCVLC